MIVSNAWAAGSDPRDDNVVYESRLKKTFVKKSKSDHVIRIGFIHRYSQVF